MLFSAIVFFRADEATLMSSGDACSGILCRSLCQG